MGWCADYRVVAKSSGLVIHGDLVSEDANTVTLKVHNAEVSFRKERLDLARMKELNQRQPVEGNPPNSAASDEAAAPDDRNALIRGLEQRIAERKRTLANYQSQPASGDRDRHIAETEEELSRMRRALVDLRIEHGVAEDPAVAELRNRHEEAFAQAEAAKQAYDSLPANASKEEMDARWQRFREAEARWNDAKDALTKALQQEP
jgi:hypothetical protein